MREGKRKGGNTVAVEVEVALVYHTVRSDTAAKTKAKARSAASASASTSAGSKCNRLRRNVIKEEPCGCCYHERYLCARPFGYFLTTHFLPSDNMKRDPQDSRGSAKNFPGIGMPTRSAFNKGTNRKMTIRADSIAIPYIMTTFSVIGCLKIDWKRVCTSGCGRAETSPAGKTPRPGPSTRCPPARCLCT